VALAFDPRASHIESMRKHLVIVPLVALLAIAIHFAVVTWHAIEGPPVPAEGLIAMWLGIVFSLIVGCGLMALVFYSSRRGYDDAVGHAPADGDRPSEMR
jgi:hypothetical protein